MYQLFISSIFLLFTFQCFAQTGLESSPQKMGNAINLDNCSISSPELTFDGQSLFVTVKGHRQNVGYDDLEDIWCSMQKERNWTHPINLGAPVNKRLQDKMMGLSTDGETLYLMNELGQLMVTQKYGRFWSKPKALDIPGVPSIGIAKDYHISASGTTILMAIESNLDNQSDLFVSFITSTGKWSIPKPLGTMINSAKDEISVFLSFDEQSIYFSSNGWGGEGGFDLFKSQRLDGTWENWSTPKNLGTGINSTKDEVNCTFSAKAENIVIEVKEKNDFSSLYIADLPTDLQPNPVVVLKGKITNAFATEERELQVQSLETFSKRLTVSASQDGTFKCVVPFGEALEVYAQTEGYFSQSTHFDLSDRQLEEIDYDYSNATADLNLSEAYNQRELDITRLRERLEKIDTKLEAFGKLRFSFEQQALKERRAKAKEGATFYQTDTELEALKNRYDNFLQRTSSENNLTEAFAFEDPYHFLQDTIIPKGRKTESEEDKELAKMRQRYKNYYVKKKGYLPKEDKEEEGLMWEDGLSPNQSRDVRVKSGELANTPSVEALQLPHTYAAENKPIQIDTLSDSEPLKSMLASGFQKKQEKQTKENWQNQFRPSFQDKQPIAEQGTNLENQIDIQSIRKEEKKVKQELEVKVLQQINEEQNAGYQNDRVLLAANQSMEKQKNTPTYQEVEKEITLIPIQIGQTIQLNNIFFQANSAILKSTSFQELERVLAFLHSNPKVVVELAAHTNGDLSHTFAMQLSNKRAKTIQDYLLSNGISMEQILAQGYGKMMPLVEENTPKDKRRNQRIEMKIIELND
ncbi:MAG: OmpA family protein [Saprospiraceae bacterium]|jgi:outer membrane protein OmpA-like peptidoglycan-associated protein|nr:OmpA family protein [Saprospiraceae bacterium]